MKDIVKEEIAKVWRSSVAATTIVRVRCGSDKEYYIEKNETTELARTDTSLTEKSFRIENSIIETSMSNCCLMKNGNLKST